MANGGPAIRYRMLERLEVMPNGPPQVPHTQLPPASFRRARRSLIQARQASRLVVRVPLSDVSWHAEFRKKLPPSDEILKFRTIPQTKFKSKLTALSKGILIDAILTTGLMRDQFASNTDEKRSKFVANLRFANVMEQADGRS